ncbi:hypothetical protein AcW1_003353 [Taiwanofungus camphoratus]|nr:hypothetical protein AcV5_002186 [Antrodia cinnamomea]KAI0941473.1 hypothetical protein AcW1_003353 [Antrodia cinnamomea]KAI0944030.1 hypothetical protein AcV7_001962 [Antrodia cinnamomea]
MPKRIPTPPPGDDEPRYLTVVHPYPPHANMELETDRKVFAFWLACCIGKDNLYAFFHKPLSPNMVIIEVNRNFPDFNNLLGEHRWRNFLRKPSQDEEDRVSKVFYCTYSTGREVQKYGWKRIFVEERWFKEWSPQNILIAYPYPVTYRCEVPSEDKTREPLCRPLPVQTFPPPPPIRPPPVGSPAWIDDKQSASAEAVNAHGGAWARGTPAATRAKGVPPSLTISDVQRPGSSLSSASAPSRSSPDRNDIGAWGRWPSPSPSSIGTPPGIPIQSGLKAPSTSSNSIASSAIGSGTAQELPPLEHNSSSTSPQLSATSSEGDESGWWPAVSTLNNNVVVANQGFERVMEGLSIEDDMDSAAEDGCAVPAPAQEPKNLWTTAAPVQVYKSLWANEEESQEPQLTLLCTEHGVTCKKGICKVYAAQLKAQQRAEREKKREKEREKRAARGVDKGRGKNKGKGETGGMY